MNEEMRSVKAKGYEHLYYVTRSGRIINKKTGHVKVYDANPYGFPNVHLYKNGDRESFNTYELWKGVFYNGINESEYKGMK